MGYIFTYKDSVACESWHSSRQFHRVKKNQGRLLMDLLKPRPYDSVLDIGCGTGEILSFLSSQKALQLSGVDPSPYMLDFARQKLGNRVDLYRAHAEDLPFEDNAFNHVIMMTSLEFTEDPLAALEEAARVAKDRLFIGMVNRYAFGGLHKGAAAVLERSVFGKAHFFNVWEIKAMIRSILGNVPVSCRAMNLMAPESGGFFSFLEHSAFFRKSPFGPYMGLVVNLVPTYRVRPLPITFTENGTPEMAGGHFSAVGQKTSHGCPGIKSCGGVKP
jgi:SAM-dependent methyltransferase